MTHWLNYQLPALAAGFSLFVLFGVSGATIIFSLYLVCISFCFYIAKKEPSAAIYIYAVFWTMLSFNQIHYVAKINESAFYMFFIISSVFSFSWFVINAIRSRSDIYEMKGESNPAENRAYIVLKRPKTMIDYIGSLLGVSASSISFCHKGKWIRFKSKNDEAVLCSLADRKGFVFLDIGHADDFDHNVFMSVKGKQWSWRKNCVTAWSAFLEDMWLEPRPWEWLPSVYAKRIIGKLNEKRAIFGGSHID